MPANKYGAKKTEIDGFVFDSKAESRRYSELKLLEKAGEIRDLELQPNYAIVVNKTYIAAYFSDFRYFDITRKEIVVEDVKGMKTPVYRLKKKLVEAIYGIHIMEIT